MLTEFNKGGSHESNPNGGIPLGQNSEGKQNTVEQGETKKDNYIYSDRLYINEDLVKQMNLPGYIKGKSFANASKSINDKFKGRNDIHTKATQKELLDRLAQSQEQLKAEQEAINNSMKINQSEIDYPEDSQQFAGGGFTNFMKSNGSSVNSIGDAFAGQGSYGKSLNDASSVGFNDSKLEKDIKNEQLLGKTKDTVASAFGPIGQFWRGIQKVGKGIGDSIGGEGGAVVSGLFSPEEATMSNLTNKDMNVGQKILGTVPGLGAVMAKNSADKRLSKFNDDKLRMNNFYKYQYNENDDDVKVFAEGGLLDDPKKKPLPGIVNPINSKSIINDMMVGDPNASSRYLNIVGMQKGITHPKKGYGAYFYSGKTPNDPGFDPMVNREFIQQNAISDYLNSEQGKKYQTLLKAQIESEKAGGLPITSYSYLKPAQPVQQFANGGQLPGMATPSDISNFQDYINSNKLGQLSKDGILGPKTTSAYNKYYPEYKKGLLNSIDEEGLKRDLILSEDRTPDNFNSDKYFNYKKPETQVSSKPGFFNKVDISSIGNNLLRYSPVLSNILQKSKMGAVEVENAIKNPYQYKKQYIDDQTYQNTAKQQSANTIDALAKSGISGNQLVSAMLATDMNRTKSVSEGAMAAKMHNINENKLAEQVKQANESDFIADKRRINDVNAQNRANYDTQRSKFDSAIGTSLGEIGKEETFKKMAEKITGYDWMGKYLKANPNATEKEVQEAWVKDQKDKKTNTEEKKYGGLMSLKFKKY